MNQTVSDLRTVSVAASAGIAEATEKHKKFAVLVEQKADLERFRCDGNASGYYNFGNRHLTPATRQMIVNLMIADTETALGDVHKALETATVLKKAA